VLNPVSDIGISGLEYSASVNLLGGGLAKLTYLGRNLVEVEKPLDARNLYWGSLLAPWPNRIRDGVYNIGTRQFHLPPNELSRKCSLHGLINILEWEVVCQTDSSVRLKTTLPNSEHYPTSINFEVNYLIVDRGLVWTLNATNTGPQEVPYGASIHPYLIADEDTSIGDWSLKLPATHFFAVDAQRLLPISIETCAGTNLDFQNGRTIGNSSIDNAFQIDKANPNQRIEIISASGRGVWMEYDSSSKWIQVHTADRDGAPDGRKSLAIEPMSCPPDAFNSGTDLIWLKPGESHAMTWHLGAIG
jgi:aldose 1-epimerase